MVATFSWGEWNAVGVYHTIANANWGAVNSYNLDPSSPTNQIAQGACSYSKHIYGKWDAGTYTVIGPNIKCYYDSGTTFEPSITFFIGTMQNFPTPINTRMDYAGWTWHLPSGGIAKPCLASSYDIGETQANLYFTGIYVGLNPASAVDTSYNNPATDCYTELIVTQVVTYASTPVTTYGPYTFWLKYDETD